MIHPDLHLHTTASDGILNPDELARQIQRAGVTLFSVTDHDTLSALPQAANAAYDRELAFIPGVEISTEGEEEIHILGYGVNPEDERLLSFFSDLNEMRLQRNRAIVQRLNQLGFALDWEEILSSAGGTLGRPHIARAMMSKGYVSSVSEAFDRYLAKGRPAFVPRRTPGASQAISLLKSRGAVPVLAHPGLIKWPRERLLPLLRQWVDAGLSGLEVYHPANKSDYPAWDRLARQMGLLVTGGSDFHDFSTSHGQIGETWPHWPTALEDGWALYRAARKHHQE